MCARAGEIDLSNESSGRAESVSTTGTVTLDAAGGAIVDENGSTVYASTLMLTATARDRHSQQPPGNLLARHSDFDGGRWRRPVP